MAGCGLCKLSLSILHSVGPVPPSKNKAPPITFTDSEMLGIMYYANSLELLQ